MKNKRITQAEYRNKTKIIKQRFYSLIGLNCFICKSNKLLSCHRKDLRKHEPIANLSIQQLKKENPNDYVRLCFECHYGIHWVNQHLNLSWEDVENKLKLIKSLNSCSGEWMVQLLPLG